MRTGTIIATGIIIVFILLLTVDCRKLWRSLARYKKVQK